MLSFKKARMFSNATKNHPCKIALSILLLTICFRTAKAELDLQLWFNPWNGLLSSGGVALGGGPINANKNQIGLFPSLELELYSNIPTTFDVRDNEDFVLSEAASFFFSFMLSNIDTTRLLIAPKIQIGSFQLTSQKYFRNRELKYNSWIFMPTAGLKVRKPMRNSLMLLFSVDLGAPIMSSTGMLEKQNADSSDILETYQMGRYENFTYTDEYQDLIDSFNKEHDFFYMPIIIKWQITKSFKVIYLGASGKVIALPNFNIASNAKADVSFLGTDLQIVIGIRFKRDSKPAALFLL